MDPITLPYHLIIPSLVTLAMLIWTLIIKNRSFKKNPLTWICIIIFLLLYLLVVGSAAYDDIYYQIKLNEYDLNQDGLFSGDEVTDDMKEAMHHLVSDTGRNFSFITGFISSGIVTLSIYIIGKTIILIRKYSRGKRQL